MAAASLPAVTANLGALVETFGLQEAKEPFSFRLQPTTQLDSVFCLLVEGRARAEYCGQAEMVTDVVRLMVARKIRRDPQGAVLGLQATINSLVVAIARHQPSDPDFSASVQGWKTPPPSAGEDFAVAEIEVLVDYDSVL